MIKNIKKKLNSVIKKIFPIAQKLGLNITLNHYSSAIPDSKRIRR